MIPSRESSQVRKKTKHLTQYKIHNLAKWRKSRMDFTKLAWYFFPKLTNPDISGWSTYAKFTPDSFWASSEIYCPGVENSVESKSHSVGGHDLGMIKQQESKFCICWCLVKSSNSLNLFSNLYRYVNILYVIYIYTYALHLPIYM